MPIPASARLLVFTIAVCTPFLEAYSDQQDYQIDFLAQAGPGGTGYFSMDDTVGAESISDIVIDLGPGYRFTVNMRHDPARAGFDAYRSFFEILTDTGKFGEGFWESLSIKNAQLSPPSVDVVPTLQSTSILSVEFEKNGRWTRSDSRADVKGPHYRLYVAGQEGIPYYGKLRLTTLKSAPSKRTAPLPTSSLTPSHNKH